MSSEKTPLLIINGPNLNLTGTRQPEIYGRETLADILIRLDEGFPQFEFVKFQSNHEGALIDELQQTERYKGLIINAGAYAHTSIALRDALENVSAPKAEVHLSNLWKREDFRHTSMLSPVCDGVISGFGGYGYWLAAVWMAEKLGDGQKRD